MSNNISNNIKKLRTQRHITQKQLATYLGVTEQAVSRWESGGYPDIQLVPSIASFFGVTTDDLFGLNNTEKENRLTEIRSKIKAINECGTSNEDTLAEARVWMAEFPGEADIVEHLANELCGNYMWDGKQKEGPLKEAEKLFLTLYETTDDAEYRNSILEKLAALYSSGFGDLHKTKTTADKLPTMKYCRESVKSSIFSVWSRDHSEPDKLSYAQDYIKKLADALCTSLIFYTIHDIPNNSERWDEKISYFEMIQSIYEFIFGENMLFYHERVAYINRIIATYKVAQGKHEETLDYLEEMVRHDLLADEAKPGDKYTSPFLDKLTYEGATEDFDAYTVHNCAYYSLEKMSQDRYDPIRNTERFKIICDTLEKSAK